MAIIFVHPRELWALLRQTWSRFIADDTFQEGAALAYYAVFALPALLVLITRIVGALFGPDVISGALFRQVSKIVGPEGAADVQQMVTKASQDEGFSVAAVVGVVTLFIAATGVFLSMQETLNAIWGVKAKPQRAWVKMLLDRLRGLGLLLAVGFLLLISLVVQTVVSGIGHWFSDLIPGTEIVWLNVVNLITSIGVSTLLFAAIFRILPDATIRWRSVWTGSLLTALLFTLGKFLIGYYLGHSNFGSIYGAAGTVIVLLAWVFYSSQILFFGAVFTRCFAERFGMGIRPSAHAVRVKVVEITDDDEVKVKHDPNAPPEGEQHPDAAALAGLSPAPKPAAS